MQTEMSLVEKLEKRITAAIPLATYPYLVRRDVVGLVYHAVAGHPLPFLEAIYPCKTPQMFALDLAYLKSHFYPISYDELLDSRLRSARLPQRSVLVTFDDGYEICHSVVRPLLLSQDVPCTFFIPTDFIGNRVMFYRNKLALCIERIRTMPSAQLAAVRDEFTGIHGQPQADREALAAWVRGLAHHQESLIDRLCERLGIQVDKILDTQRPYLNDEQIRELAADGFTIGAHSRRHVKFNLLDARQIEAEVVASCQRIMEITGRQRIPFAFPFSGYGLDGDLLTRLAQKHPFIDLYFDARGMHKDHPLVIDRVWADPPPEGHLRKSNLPQLLHRAYQEHVQWRRRYLQLVLKAKISR